MTTPDDRIQSFIDRLVASAGPVRRLASPGLRLVAWLGVVLAVGAAAVAGVGPAAAARLAAPRFAAEVACLAAAAIAAAAMALRGSVPGLDEGPARRALVAALAAGVVLGLANTRLSFATPAATFVAGGIGCFVSCIVIALLPWGAIMWAIGRGVPLHPASTGAAGGLAASIAAYLLVRVRCLSDDTLHVAAWHGLPVLAATIAAAWLGSALLRARRGGSAPL